MNKLSNNKFHLFFMYIIILGYLFIPRFIVADDVLCPNKDEQGNKSCGYYKRQCEYTRESYEQTVGEESTFKNTLLRIEVSGVFGNMKVDIQDIKETLETDRYIRNTDWSDNEKKEELLSRWENTYRYCNSNYYYHYIRCMGNALVTINGLSYEDTIKKKYTHDFAKICNNCIETSPIDGNILKCANEQFQDLQQKIFEQETATTNEENTEESDTEESKSLEQESDSETSSSKDNNNQTEEEQEESNATSQPKKGCEGIKLNTEIPFVGNCIPTGSQSEVFPIFIGGLIKFMMSLLLLIGFICILIGGIMITMGKVTEGKNLIMKVIRALAAIGGSGVILKIINPNFFS